MRKTDGFIENWNGFEWNVPSFSSESQNINIIAWVDAIDRYISVKSKYVEISSIDVDVLKLAQNYMDFRTNIMKII